MQSSYIIYHMCQGKRMRLSEIFEVKTNLAVLFSFTFGYFWLFSVIFRYFPLFSLIFIYFRLFSVFFGYFRLFPVIFRYFRLFSGYFRLFPVISGYFRLLKNEKNEFCMSNNYGRKIDLIASKFFVELDFLQFLVEFFGQNDWSINFRDI